MRVLMLHDRYQIRGGEDESADAEIAMLRSAGHEVDFLEANNDTIVTGLDRVSAAISTVWSTTWYRLVDHALRQAKYDILHVQNFFPLISPAVYYAAKANGVAVVQAVRNYRMACPSHNLFRDGKLCRDCVGTTFKLPGLHHKCYRDSVVGTGAVAAMSSVHRIAGTWKTKVDRYIAVSRYVADVLKDDGFPTQKISVKPNFVDVDGLAAITPTKNRNYLLYVGRLNNEKGVDTLLDAYAQLETSYPLYIVGEGKIDKLAPDNVHFLGKNPLDEVYALMRDAAFVVMPGNWPEPFGRVAVEAFAHGTPVISSNSGGVTELIENGKNGLVFPPGNSSELAKKISKFLHDDKVRAAMSLAARNSYEAHYTPAKNLLQLEVIYREAITAAQIST